MKILCGSLIAVLSACVSTTGPVPIAPSPTPAPAAPAEIPAFAKSVFYQGHAWDPKYDLYTSEALDDYGAHLLAGDLAKPDLVSLCPGYFRASIPQRKAVWALLVASIAGPESDYSLTSKMRESAGEWSLGLLQLSYEDYSGHKRCELRRAPGSVASATKPADGNAYDARINIRCGISILDDQVAAGAGIFVAPGHGAYWSTLYPPANKVMVTWNKYSPQLSFCGVVK